MHAIGAECGTSVPERRLTIVVMAKLAAPGRVKTRLASTLTEPVATAVYVAMRRCLLARLQEVCCDTGVTFTLAVDRPCDPEAQRDRLQLGREFGGYRMIEQGEGDLGQRLDRVWRAMGQGPLLFLGTDSPDLPSELVQGAAAALNEADVALGPTSDGGYWTLGARRYEPRLLEGVDWGTDRVYHQTLTRAREVGLRVASQPVWHDVDEPADLQALRQRLADASDPFLRQLDEDLTRIGTARISAP